MPFVLAEHEAARQLGLPRPASPRPARLGALADLVAVASASATTAGDPEQDRQARAAARARAPQGWRRARSDCIVAGPIPLTWSSWSTEARPPCWSRYSTIFCAVTGPIPSIVSSCSAVAVPRLIGPSSALPRRRRPRRRPAPLRDHHLLAVGEAGGEVDRLQQRPGAGASGPLDGIGDPAPRPAAGRRPAAHRPGHVDDDV